MRVLISSLLVVAMVGSASAQYAPQPAPAPQPYPQPAPQPQPYPPPPPYSQQPYGPQAYGPPGYGAQQRPVMQYQLTVDEQYLLERGYISDGAWIGGGIVNVFWGYGIGQAIQGRWSDRGWIFTLGEGASTVAMIYGFTQLFDECFEGCDNSDHGEGLLIAGMVGVMVFHVWGAIDAFVVPPSHNRKLTELRMRLGMPVPMYARVSPYLTAPKGDTGGAVAGLSLRF